MNLKIADEKVYELDLIERSKLSFDNLALKVTKSENNEKLLSQKEIQALGFHCEPFWDIASDIEGDCYEGYIEAHPNFSLSIRSEVANKLVLAQKNLPKHWNIVLKAGFRPLAVQVQLLDAVINLSRQSNPSFTDQQHLKYARLYVADPTIKCPPHVTGGAIDLDIFDSSTNKFIDMGCPPNTDGEIAGIHSKNINNKQHQNRITLLTAMLDAGFAPMASEWWHYQYGETYWAAFYGYETTKYDLITV